MSEYLNSITLSSDTDEINEGEFVTLATIHSVKGLEYRCVFVCGLDSEIFPMQRALEEDTEEEERRLMYVAITRARERLFLTRARSRFLYGSRRATEPSIFLEELSEKLGVVKNKGGRYGEERFSYDGQNRYSGYGDGSSFGGGYGGGYGGYSDKNGYSGNYSRGNVGNYGNYGGKSYKNEKSDYGYSGSYENGSGGSYGGSYSGSAGGFKKNSYASGYNAAGVSKPTEKVQSSDLEKIRTGTNVRHKKFGDGVVIATKTNGGEIVADVAFKGVGIKSLVLRLAPIEVID